jgi:hypothetical protein
MSLPVFDDAVFDDLVFDCESYAVPLVQFAHRHLLALSLDTTPLARRSALAMANQNAKRARRSR